MTRNDRTAIAAAEEELAAAHLTLDLAVLDRLLHPSFTILQPDGQLERKDELIASLQSGERFWEHAHVDDLSVDVYGATGIVYGRWRARGYHGATRFDYAARFSSVWLWCDGRWQNLAYHAVEVTVEGLRTGESINPATGSARQAGSIEPPAE